jgi:hypothetical protein
MPKDIQSLARMALRIPGARKAFKWVRSSKGRGPDLHDPVRPHARVGGPT